MEIGLNRNDIIDRLKSLPFDSDDYWIVMGAALVLHGLKCETSDIDIGCSRTLFVKLLDMGYTKIKSRSGLNKIVFSDDITFYCEWNVEYIVFIEGIKVESIEGIVKDKQKFARNKDIKDIELISAKLCDACFPYHYLSAGKILRGIVHKGFKEEPVIIVHGFFSSNKIGPYRLYYLLAEQLNKIGYTVLRIDLSAMGESEGRDREIDFSTHVEDLCNVINSFIYNNKYKNIHILAHCVGCCTSIKAMSFIEDSVSSITLLAPFMPTEKNYEKLLGTEQYNRYIMGEEVYHNSMFCNHSFIEAGNVINDELLLDKCKKKIVVMQENNEFVLKEVTI